MIFFSSDTLFLYFSIFFPCKLEYLLSYTCGLRNFFIYLLNKKTKSETYWGTRWAKRTWETRRSLWTESIDINIINHLRQAKWASKHNKKLLYTCLIETVLFLIFNILTPTTALTITANSIYVLWDRGKQVRITFCMFLLDQKGALYTHGRWQLCQITSNVSFKTNALLCCYRTLVMRKLLFFLMKVWSNQCTHNKALKKTLLKFCRLDFQVVTW